MSTRKKILSQSRLLFNDKGYGSVLLNDIAAKCDISRTNLLYHFKDKEALLVELANEMWEQFSAERSKSRQFPSFENLKRNSEVLYKLQKAYKFIFLDTHVLNHPVLKKPFREITTQNLEDNKAAIAFSISLGNMRAEQVPGTYNNLAFITWMLTFFWLPQQVIRGAKKEDDGLRMAWSILIPHFTDKGIASFKTFFGEDYFNSLGQPFEYDLKSLIRF